MKKRTKFAKEKGITLIALVITIIVLLILAAVSIATLTGQNGILTRADEAAEETGRKTAEEKVAVEVLGSYGKDGNIEYDRLNENLGHVEGLTEGLPISKLPSTVVVDGYDVTINEDGSVTVGDKEQGGGETGTLPSTEDTKPFLPDDNSEIIEDDLSKGVVVKDSNGNEWTWIEVPKSIYTNTEYNGGTAPANSEDYGKIESTMQKYAETYRESNYEDTWYSEDQHGFTSSTEYDNWKNEMLKSVYENGGFYIGRYEAGSFDNPVTANDNKGRKAVIQEGAYPYNYVKCKQAQELSEELATEGRTSSLMFGIQWDLVLKHIENKKGKIQEELKEDSTTWGNYMNATFDVKRGKYSIYSNYKLGKWTDVPANYNKPEYSSYGNGVLLSTGAVERNSILNIYDLAGNVDEWTLEKSIGTEGPCVRRGGHYYEKGSERPTSHRINDYTGNGSDGNGFRPALW